MSANSQRHIILFDGQCNLCHGAVSFIVARDNPLAERGVFSFAPLQSDTAKRLIIQCAIPTSEVDKLTSQQAGSFVLITADRYYLGSDAALEVASQLTGLWRYLTWLKIIPKPIRDGLYRLIGRYRYRLFGRRPLCLLPSPALRSRFLP